MPLPPSIPAQDRPASVAQFQKISLPTGQNGYVPADIQIRLPTHNDIAPERLHLLAYIPWDDKYLSHVPAEYRDFFRYVLPHLGVRTTNVHTVVSMSFLPELIAAAQAPVDERLIYIALIVHDCGWSKLTHHDIADSLDYSGIAFNHKAAESKIKHTVYGSAHAFQLLSDYTFDPLLTVEQRYFISDIVHYHERPLQYIRGQNTPAELIIACEADRLWPFTHENFWLDTIRKGVEPEQYIENVAAAVDDMLLTEQGKSIARRLVAQRRGEVAELVS
ncbi:MAG TPA: hypothetical protein VGO07_01115 [Candidatus Saccharimonadales bacterium]|jgi:hypothetical protein|nr:hypothetical protein [Candidatus Saccharimonadales bacterium]